MMLIWMLLEGREFVLNILRKMNQSLEERVLDLCVSKDKPFTEKDLTEDFGSESTEAVKSALNKLVEKKKISAKEFTEQGSYTVFWIPIVEPTQRTIEELKAEVAGLTTENNRLEKERKSDPETLYIKSLHEYNELKDAGVALMGRLAELEESTVKEMYKRFGLELDD